MPADIDRRLRDESTGFVHVFADGGFVVTRDSEVAGRPRVEVEVVASVTARQRINGCAGMLSSTSDSTDHSHEAAEQRFPGGGPRGVASEAARGG